MEALLRIGAAATAAGLTVHTVRFYEDAGILPPARRAASGYREYSQGDVRRLRLVRNARALGVPLAELQSLVRDLESARCDEYVPRLAAIIARQQGAMEEKLAALLALKVELDTFATYLDGLPLESAHSLVRDCPSCPLLDEEPCNDARC